MEVQNSETIPPFVVALHRLARLGRATVYGGLHNRLVQIDLDDPKGEVLSGKWDALEGVTRVYLIYDDRRIMCL